MDTGKEKNGYSNADYSAAIEGYLSDKYSLSFKVDSLGGVYGTSDNSTVKAWCHSVDGSYANIRFMAEVNKENLRIVKDNYLHIVSAGMISDKLCNNHDGVAAYSIVESSTYSTADSILELNEYLAGLDTYFVTTHFFVKDSESMSVNDYVNMVYSIGESAKGLNLQDLCIVVWFVDEVSSDFAKIFSETSVDKLYDAFLSSDLVNCHATIQLTEDEITTKHETIQSSIEKGVR
ncbi:MAG: hypothetical protein IKK00_04135 [Oscillospiraceae bacterium]|nr:hypothetical protein [Oscillospiraceae bacterium]